MVSRLITLRWRSKAASSTFAAAVAVLALALAASAMRVAYPAQLADSQNLDRVRRAAALDAHNDVIQHSLGIAEQWFGGDRKEAVAHFRQAALLNPRRAEYWSDLARSCFVTGGLECAESGYRRAAQLAPRRPAFHWDVANYYLVTGQREHALQSFSELLSMAPEDSRSALELCLRAYQDPALVWTNVVEPLHSAGAQLTLLSLMASLQIGDTEPYWTKVRETRFNFNLAAPYVDALLTGGAYPLARQVWSDLEHDGVVPSLDASGVYNGDFEVDPLQDGFDWHIAQGQQFIDASLDASVAHSGRRSLRVDFTFPHNDDYMPVFEIVAVTPGQSLTLNAWVKSDSITSDSGPRLRIVDPRCAACLDVSTDGTTGTTGWHEARVTFTPGPQTTAVQVMVWRGRSRSFPMEISGTFWVDSVSLLLSASPKVAGQ